MKLKNPLNIIKNALSDIRTCMTSLTRFPMKLEMSFGKKNVVITQQHLFAKFMRANKNHLSKKKDPD